MTERWRRKLGALGGIEPDAARLRDRALHGPRLPGPSPRPARAIVAGAVSIALAVGSFGLLRTTFGQDRATNDGPPFTASPDASVSPGVVALDPDTVCDVPAYDPNVALLGESWNVQFDPSVGPREFPLKLLEAPGEPASTIEGSATEALRRSLEGGQGRNAPQDGWRAIARSPDEVIFAAPPEHSSSLDWWIVRFVSRDGEWRFEHTELVDQHQTPAQLGRSLRLSWRGAVVFDEGRWDSSLWLTNERGTAWTVGEDGYELWGHVHVFDPVSGGEIGHVARTVGDWGPSLQLGPGASDRLPISLGGALPDLASDRTYDAIACVPQLGLASPVGTLRVEDNTAVRTVRVLTYPDNGVAMQALGGGRLMVHNGCLAVAERSPRPIYVLWPDGYAMVYRQQEIPVLIDAVGREVARLGDDVTLGGGYVPPDNADAATIGGVPEECRTRGEGYFLTSGLA